MEEKAKEKRKGKWTKHK
jgi:hypothetical protein